MALDWADSTQVQNGGAGTTTIVLPKPTNVADGDYMLALLTWTSGSVTVSGVPSGWTLFRTNTTGGSNQITTATYWKIASSEGSSYTWTLTGTGIQNSGTLWQITGAHPSAPSDVSNGNNGQGKNPNVSTVTTGFNDEMIILLIGYTSNAAGFSFTLPAAFTTHTLFTSGGSSRMVACEKMQAGAGATGTFSASVNAATASDWWSMQVLGIRPTDPGIDAIQPGQDDFPVVLEHYDSDLDDWPFSYTGWINVDGTPLVFVDIVPYCFTDVPDEFYETPWEQAYPLVMSHPPLSVNAPTPTPSSTVSNLITPRVSLVPGSMTDDAQWKRQAATWMQEANKGHLQNTGIVTLTASQSSTVVTDDRAGPNSFIEFMPRTANAAAEKGNGTLYIQSQGKQTFTISHANNAQTDRTYIYTILG